MCSHRALLFAGALGLLVGCYDSHECGPEVCDYDDSDCDRRIDEDFLDEDGIYATLEHCGGCNVACPEVFPTAAETACEVDRDAGTAECVIVACPAGWHLAGDGACAPDVPALCLTCTEDEDCALRQPGAACREMPSGERRCLTPCERDCPAGFVCNGEGLCEPSTGICGCTEETLGAELACLVERDEGYRCAGVMRCTEDGIGACEPVLEETCNERDDDCDGAVDETFRDGEGRYVDRLHCGGCAIPCVEPGANMMATCLPAGPAPAVTCEIECLEGFVDVDGLQANGCECERYDGEGPPPVVGGDADCDGVPDETNDFVYVATTGSDTNPGTLERPMRSVGAALRRGEAEDKDVLVARGVYDGRVDLVSGVSAYGGYRPDFRDRDLTLYPVVLVNEREEPGAPVVRCEDVREETRFEGFEIQGSDATRPGTGSTAVYLDGCTDAVVFASDVVLAGRAADGASGRSASEVLRERFGVDLPALDGRDGVAGFPGTLAGECNRVVGGASGARVCPDGRDIGGGTGAATDCPELFCRNGAPCGNSGCTDFTPPGGECDFAAMMRAAVPNPAPTSGRGSAGGAAGARTYNAPTNRGVCNFCDDNPTLQRNGDPGGDGGEGVDGVGGSGCGSAPRFDASTGRVTGGAGTPGTDGTHGSGGGGGSSGGGYEVIGGTEGTCTDHAGGTGGGGGSGGCGSPGATAGTGGGSSLGIVVRLAPGASRGPVMEDVRVVTASAGGGGRGGQGASGGAAGSGGNGGDGRHWCARVGGRGGDGGRGGAGGGGGGGCGGSTHGVAVVPQGGGPGGYVAELEATLTVDRVGVAGRGGPGGYSPSASGSAGADGSDDAIRVLGP